MIRKYLKIDAPPEAVFRELTDHSSWSQWWAGLKKVDLVEEAEKKITVDLAFSMKITIKMTLELDYSQENTIRFRQLKGWFKAYSGEWVVVPAPDGPGTTLKATTDAVAGGLVSKRMLHSSLADSLDQMEQKLNQRLRGKAAPAVAASVPTAAQPTSPAAASPVGRRIHVFPTRKGLEVWVAGRRYLMNYAGWSREDAPDFLAAQP